MKKTFLKKALTFISAAVMAGAVGLGAGLNVHAADGDTATTGGKTNVTLTKLAVKSPASIDQRELYEQTDLNNGDVVPNAGFEVYDVTDAYWKLVDDGKATDSKSLNENVDVTDPETKETKSQSRVFTELGAPIDSATTDSTGKAHFNDLANYNAAGQYKVYLFRETSAPKGYKFSPDFVLSLPAKDKDGNVMTEAYVYPKDEITGNYQLKFTKRDANNDETKLEGAAFTIKSEELGKFAQVEGYVGKDAPLPGFSETSVTVKWVDTEDEATYFTSDTDGAFGFAAETQKTNNGEIYGLAADGNYTIHEMTAPKGYQKDAKIDGDTDLTVTADGEHKVLDTPEGILPHTGGAGIIAIVAVGLVMTVVGVVAYNKRRVNA
jgi:LPXTG-motif cell wall-anchored protein